MATPQRYVPFGTTATIEKAKEAAVNAAPTERGFFDGRARIEAFLNALVDVGLIIFIGRPNSDDIEYLLLKYDLEV